MTPAQVIIVLNVPQWLNLIVVAALIVITALDWRERRRLRELGKRLEAMISPDRG